MRIKEQKDFTTIYFHSQQYKESSFLAAIGLLMFPGLLLMWIGLNFDTPDQYWTYVALFYAACSVFLFYTGSFEKKIEIHPERLYVKSSLFEPEYEYPVEDKMVILFENYPQIKLFLPKEHWRVSIGYEKTVYELIEEVGQKNY